MVLPFGEVSLLSLSIVFIFGAIIGSFLNVVILRLHTGKSLQGRSHCMTCGHTLGVVDLVPVLSYAALLGRCRHCGARFSARYAFVEVLTACAFVLAYATALHTLWFVASAGMLSLLVVVLMYDLDHLIIPDEYVIALFVPAVALALFSLPFPPGLELFTLLVAPLSASGFLYALWKLSQGRWIGLGDAKLAAPLALVVGAQNVFSFVVTAFWVGAGVSVCILLLQKIARLRGQHRLRFFGNPLTIKSEIPFAPFLIASFVLVYYFGFSAFAVTEYFMSYVL
jgi:leader peptidase (prepilin peptidase) / N-methyltransferase